MDKNIVKFDIGLINNYLADKDAEFAVMELKFLSDGYNAHGLPITEEILRRDAKSILGKPIVAKYDKYANDVKGHETDEVMVGYVPNNASIKFEKTKNGTFAVVDGLVSKLYSNDVYKLYKTHNQRAVSVEMVTDWLNNDPDSEVITGLNICGVTLLGLTYDPSCTLASSKIVRFSLENADNFYEYKMQDENLKDFAERRKAKMEGKTYKINTEELKTSPWGGVNKTELRKRVMDASNRSSLVKKVYLQVLAGWEDAPSSKLKYPVMQLIGDTFYYNRDGLAAAKAYATQYNDSEVLTKLKPIYKKFGLEFEEGEDKKMATEKLEIEGRKAWGKVIKKVESHEGKGVYVNSVEKDHIIYTKDDVRYHVDADVEVSKDDKTVDAKIDWGTKKKDADQKMSKCEDEEMAHKFEDDDDEDDDDIKKDKKEGVDIGKDDAKMKKDKKKMSSDENVDGAALEEMLEKEAERNKRLADKLDDKDNIIMEQEAELEELRKFKDDALADMKKKEVDSTLANIKGFISEEMYRDLQDEGMACKFSSVDAWKNKAQAVAFEAMKDGKTQSGIWKMGANLNPEKKSSGLWK